MPGIRASVVLSQELRLRASEIPAAKGHMAKLGWKLFAAPCLSGPGGGPSAGVAILCKSFLDMSPNLTNGPMVLVDGRVIVVPMRTAGLGLVYVYSVYLISGIALSDANITILKTLVDHIVSHGAPYVVGADWQNTPDAIRAVLAPLGLVGATVFAPDGPTYTHTLAESTIDFYIVDSRIGMNVSDVVCPSGSLISPHSPVFISLGLNGHDVVVSSVVKPPISLLTLLLVPSHPHVTGLPCWVKPNPWCSKSNVLVRVLMPVLLWSPRFQPYARAGRLRLGRNWCTP